MSKFRVTETVITKYTYIVEAASRDAAIDYVRDNPDGDIEIEDSTTPFDNEYKAKEL